MPTFKYTCKNAEAQTVRGKISADTKEEVLVELRKRKLMVLSIAEDKPSIFAVSSTSERKKKIKPEDVVLCARQLATMVDAGIPILQGMDALQDQTTHPSLKKVLIQVRDDIKLGSSLSAAFAKHGKVFDNLFVNMVKVGETGGALTTVLERVSGYMEKTLSLQRKVKSAMIYPCVVVGMSVAITILLMVKVVPTFSSIYDSFDQELPAMTQVLLTASNILKHQLHYYLMGMGLVGFIIYKYQQTEKGGMVFDNLKLRMPVFGDLICKVAVSRFCRTLAVLIQSGVPILDSLEIVGKTAGNRVLERVVQSVTESVREGESIAVPLAKSPVFPPMVTRMISIGEKSGQMEKMLTKVADFFDEQVDTAVEGLTSIIEPIIIGFLGIVIGFIVISLFLPIINITAVL